MLLARNCTRMHSKRLLAKVEVYLQSKPKTKDSLEAEPEPQLALHPTAKLSFEQGSKLYLGVRFRALSGQRKT